jgi:hypothetical protein
MKPAYIGIILDDPEVLLRWWASHVGELLPKRIAHHMTIQFRPSADDMAALPIGEPVTMDVVGYAGDAEVQAVVVRPHGVRSTNRVPHVTVATDGVTPPVRSNDLMEAGPVVPIDGPTLTGRVGFHAAGRDWFDAMDLGRRASVRVPADGRLRFDEYQVTRGHVAAARPLTDTERRNLNRAFSWAMAVDADGGTIPADIDRLLHASRWPNLTDAEARRILDWFYSTAPGDSD